MFSIRRSGTQDGSRVVDIWRDAVDATHDFLTPVDREAIECEVRSFLPTAPLWLAVDARDWPLAFMLLDDGHIEALFVDPAYRAEGIGRALVSHAHALCGAISVDVNERNGQAIGFYERLGFVRVGRTERDGQGRPYPLLHLRRAVA